MKNTVRVLVVDDSALMRKLLPQIIERDSSIQVVGTAMDGAFALDKIPELKPQVVTLDLDMPRMDGMEALRVIARKYRLPAIVVSAHTTEGAAATFRALAMGAFDFVAKPKNTTTDMDAIAKDLIAKIKVAAKSQPVQLPEPRLVARGPKAQRLNAATRVIAIGVSTGGPQALQYVLTQLPPDFSGAILIVQHMPEGFTGMFARRLDELCAIEVREARSGDLLLGGRALICPGNRHMRVKRMPLGDVVVLSDGERMNGHRPSVDVLFHSLAQELREIGIGVLMTGMGEDGADGMRAIKLAGGFTIAQSEESCVVYGMPRMAVERGYAMRVVNLEGLVSTLQAQCNNNRVHIHADPVGESAGDSRH
ncbi:MAG TPA: chemotaxis response regulator protein-glutamate methylesterase [Terriglobales bacterium]|nr:chemotaxis response regulator protein-glutamate methylesterase [Terriglobales bacterium]